MSGVSYSIVFCHTLIELKPFGFFWHALLTLHALVTMLRKSNTVYTFEVCSLIATTIVIISNLGSKAYIIRVVTFNVNRRIETCKPC